MKFDSKYVFDSESNYSIIYIYPITMILTVTSKYKLRKELHHVSSVQLYSHVEQHLEFNFETKWKIFDFELFSGETSTTRTIISDA